MAKQAEMPRAEGHEAREGRGEQRGGRHGHGHEHEAWRGGQRTGTTGGDQQRHPDEQPEEQQGSGTARGDQERGRDVARERGPAGTGMQRSGGVQGSTRAVANQGQEQPSLLPAFMASPGLMASAFMSDPFTFAQTMSEEMDRIFSSYGSGRPALGELRRDTGTGRGLQRGRQGSGAAQWVPAVEVLQRDGEMVVRADLPGLTPDDVHVDVEDGILTVSGERRQEHEDREDGWYRSERSYGAFSRSIALPDGVDVEQVRARFEHGVLEVTIPVPQRKESRARRVHIQSGAQK